VVELEDYVKGVVASEVGIHWPEEALKAQAVLARTYAITHIFEIEPEIFMMLHLLYFIRFTEEMRSTEETEEKTVKETKGQILSYNGEPVIAFYHACSVGSTEDPEEVFWKRSSLFKTC